MGGSNGKQSEFFAFLLAGRKRSGGRIGFHRNPQCLSEDRNPFAETGIPLMYEEGIFELLLGLIFVSTRAQDF